MNKLLIFEDARGDEVARAHALRPLLRLARAWRRAAGEEVELWFAPPFQKIDFETDFEIDIEADFEASFESDFGTNPDLDLDSDLALALNVPRLTQSGDNPGARLWLLLCQTLAGGAQPLLIRSGYPGLTLEHLHQARALLTEADAVFAPAADGGYALVGLTRAVPELFAGIAWGDATVMAQTRSRAARWHCAVRELALPVPAAPAS